jgi:hypothetical protein
MGGFEFKGGKDFEFKHSKKASQGLAETKRIETASVVVAVDESGDFQTIQEAINSLNGEGGYIQVKEGEYNIKETIEVTEGITITGTGEQTKLIKDASITNIMNLTDDNIKIEKLSFEGIQGATIFIYYGTGIQITTSKTNTIIKDCNFRKLNIGTNFSSQTFLISGNKFTKCTICIQLNSVQYGSLTGNIFDYNEGGNDFIVAGTGVETISITGNICWTTDYAYKGNANDYKVQITGNNFSEDAPILIAGDGCLVVGNISSTITDSGTNSTIANNGN